VGRRKGGKKNQRHLPTICENAIPDYWFAEKHGKNRGQVINVVMKNSRKKKI